MSEYRQWTEQEKEWAFEVWGLLAGRNSKRAAAILAKPPEGIEDSERPVLEIPHRTIRYWVKNDNWEERLDRKFKTMFPGIHQRVSEEIAAGSMEAVHYIRGVLRGEVKPDKTIMDGAKTMLDRAGHMPWARPSDNSRPIGPTRDYSESAAGLDEGELLSRLLGKAIDKLPEGNE